MKKDRVTVKVLPDIRRTNSKGQFSLKLRISYRGAGKYYGTGFDASREEWEIINTSEVRGELRRVRIGIAEIEKKAHDCADRIAPFSFKQFENVFFEKSIRYETLQSVFDALVQQLEINEQWGTASSYRLFVMRFTGSRLKYPWRTLIRAFLKSSKNGFLRKASRLRLLGYTCGLCGPLLMLQLTMVPSEWMPTLSGKGSM